MSVAQKPASKSHTSPGKKFAEKKGVSHSSITFTCRVSMATADKKSHFSRNYGMGTVITGSRS